MRLRFRQVVTLGLVVLAMGACKRRTPAEAPAPATTATTTQVDRARADSIAAAQARLEREARERAVAEARMRETLTDIIYFEYDSEQLTPDAEERLRRKAAIMRANPTIRVRVEGHADERGSTEYNLALGQRRAEAVRAFLSGYGIPAERVATLSYGKERPMVEGAGESVWAQNRRAEFVVLSGEFSNVAGEVR